MAFWGLPTSLSSSCEPFSLSQWINNYPPLQIGQVCFWGEEWERRNHCRGPPAEELGPRITWFLRSDLSGFFSLKHIHTRVEAKYRGGGSRGEGRLRVSHWREPITPIWHCRLAAQSGLTHIPDFSLTQEIFLSGASLSSWHSGFYQVTQAIRSMHRWITYTMWSPKIPQGVLGV